VARYRIVARLGGGGMGVVYEAEDPELGRRVALKFLPEETTGSALALERFKREARAASALNHPHICTVYDVGSHEGQPFLVMERLSGQTLKHAIAGGPLPPGRVIALGEQIADALDAAHRAGIVHRDLKSANLFVTERGDVKVLDFGLAKRVPGGTASDGSSATQSQAPDLTEAGSVLGTASYMSPEQARGQELDARSDVFSLGVVLYEMATGRLPFQGASVAEVLAGTLRETPPPPSHWNPELPPRLDEIVMAALEKDPALRTQTADDLRANLLRLRRDASTETPTGGTRAPAARAVARPGRWLRLAAAVAALAGAAYLATRDRAGAPDRAAATPDRSIAVLPFADMSPGKDQEYFCDGISEELLSMLARIPGLKVISRSSAFSYKGKDAKLAQIARELGVAHVLEGSIRRSGERVRIVARLVDARTDRQLWAQTWDRRMDDVFAVQDEIAAAVLARLQVDLLGSAPRSTPADPEAYALFLQARQVGRRATAEGWEESNDLYRRVLALQPGYAPALAGLAANYMNQAGMGLLPAAEGARLARQAVDRVLAVDPDNAEAHGDLGWIAMTFDGDLAAAARHYERALALAPADTEILRNAGTLAQYLGRLETAVAIARYVAAQDPVNPSGHHNLATAEYYAGHADAAIASLRSAQRLSPGRVNAACAIGEALLAKGLPEAALAEIEKEPSEVWRMICLPMAYHALGRAADSDAALRTLIERYGRDAAYNIAYVLAYRGEADRAFAWLDKAVEYGDTGLGDVAVQPAFASLRKDPRWLPFLRKLGRAPEQLARVPFQVTLPPGGPSGRAGS
jgi:TolB-like protein/Flp pilus assembly protein TadD/predicted Ser/Thr protein kinase